MLRAALLALALIGCGSDADRGAAPERAASSVGPLSAAHVLAARPRPAPTHEFVAPQSWQSTREGAPPVAPPDPALETWRAMVSQNQPLQKPTPRWQPLPARQTVELGMPPGSSFRCIVTPLQIAAEANDFGTKLKAWLLTRHLRCTSDGWQRWTEYGYRIRVLPDGSREEPAELGALLRELSADQKTVLHSYVLLRSDKEKREATTGPPKI